MSEENEIQEAGGMSTMKKTIIGIATTAATAIGGYVATHIEAIFGTGEEEKKEEVAAPAAQPVINLNVDNSSTNSANQSGGGTTTIIKEKTIEKAAPAQPAAPAKKSETEDSPW
jgi:hypothetical protein